MYFGPHFILDSGRGRRCGAGPGNLDPRGSFWGDIYNALAGVNARSVEDAELVENPHAQAGSVTDGQVTTTLNALVNLRKNSVRFVQVSEPPRSVATVPTLHTPAPGAHDDTGAAPAQPNASSSLYRLEFTFDASAECRIRILYLAKEVALDENGKKRIIYQSQNNRPPKTMTFGPFPSGLNQKFTLPSEHLFNPRDHSNADMILPDHREEDADEEGEEEDELGGEEE
ncbi:hypothetical protein HK104_007360, partial [Borealophlyctis nickersoniae]